MTCARRRAIYAIVRSGGRQYRVEPDQLLDVDRLPAAVGSLVEITDVLLLGANGDVKVGRPLVEGARVVAEVVEHSRDAKVLVFKYKAKTRYHRKKGHRQDYTRLAIRQILSAGEAAEAPAAAKPKRAPRRKAAVKGADPPAAPKPVLGGVEGPARPRRAAKAAAAAEAPPVEEATEAPAVEATAEAPAAETPAAAPRPKRTRKKAESE